MAATADFDLRALYDALNDARAERGISWSTVAQEVSRRRTTLRPVAASTITGLKTKAVGEGDGVTRITRW